MATKKPLALYSGKVKELQSGDDVGLKKVIARYKTARETVTSSTTLQNDDHFTFPVEANKTYLITGMIAVSCPNTGGFKWAYTLPSGASGKLTIDSGSPNLHIVNVDISTGSSTNNVIAPTTVGLPGKLSGYVTTSSNSGNVVFQWAQGTSNGTGSYIEQASTMILTEV